MNSSLRIAASLLATFAASASLAMQAAPSAPAPVRRRQEPVGANRPCPRRRADWWFDQMRLLVAEGRELDSTGVF